MEPNFNKLPNIDLPSPAIETGSYQSKKDVLHDAVEKGRLDASEKGRELSVADQSGLVSPAVNPILDSSAGTAVTGQSGSVTLEGSAVLPEDEKSAETEWINRAKAVVERTKGNPHEQADELGNVKREYRQSHESNLN